MDLQGKIALVTGGGRDIGGACVRQLAKAGAKVVVNYYQSGERAEALIAEVKADGGEAFALQGDMTDQADVDALIAKTIEAHGRIDILMHITGGIIARKTLSEMSIDHWTAVMDLNVTSLVRVVKAAVPHMTEGGSIVTMASQAARDGGGPGAMAYGASKGAVMTLTRGLAKELGPKIRVNSMCPGMIDTDFHNTFTKPEVRKNVAAATPLRREGTSDDVAKLAVYLASDDAAFITGTNVDINGGTLFS